MSTPLYKGHNIPEKLPEGAHRGLWFNRFINKFEEGWRFEAEKKGEKGPRSDPKQEWMETITSENPCGEAMALQRHTQGLQSLGELLGGESRTFRNRWRLTVGLPHPTENGFTWHPTLGVPYFCGAAVKGLVHAWMKHWQEGDEDDSTHQERLDRLFGTTDDAGGLIFFDALLTEPLRLDVDIMTPHMNQWYQHGGDEVVKDFDETVPADWHKPVPVPFLVVKEATFLFTIAPRDPAMKEEVGPVLDALEEALDWLGIGAKTGAGYGRMARDDAALDKLKSQALPSHPWLEKTIPDLMKKHKISQEEEVWRGEKLADAWQKMDDQKEKRAVLQVIKARWKAEGWWDAPPGRKTKQALKIYQEMDGGAVP